MTGARQWLFVGMSNWAADSSFHGSISNLRVWNAAVNWDGTAVAESLDQCLPHDLAKLEIPVLKVEERRVFHGTRDSFEDLGIKFDNIVLGGALSIGFTACWQSLGCWSHVIDFGNGEGDNNIFIGNLKNKNTLAFHIWVRDFEYRLQIPNGITLGRADRYLCTVSPQGHMCVYRNGQLMGEKVDGRAPRKLLRRFLYIGKSHWLRDEPFHGTIENLTVWNAVVDCKGKVRPEYPKFHGQVFAVDVAEIDRETENFQGREWLECRMRGCLPLAWDISWQPDPTPVSDNPIVLMKFTSGDTVLLLRTLHQEHYLPSIITQLLLSDNVCKVHPDFSSLHQQKMQRTFDFQPIGVISIADLAERKGLGKTNFRSLVQRFGLIAPISQGWLDITVGDWTSDLPRCLADGVYLTYRLIAELWGLVDVKFNVTQQTKEAEQILQCVQQNQLLPDMKSEKEVSSSESEQISQCAQQKQCAAQLPILPPGWRKKWHEESNDYYYADLMAKTTQWEPPPAYVHGDWTRGFDLLGHATWSSEKLMLSFKENESGDWQRYDDNGQFYWSNDAVGIRFFENQAEVCV